MMKGISSQFLPTGDQDAENRERYMRYFSVHFHYAVIKNERKCAHHIFEQLTKQSFHILDRVSCHIGSKQTGYKKKDVDTFTKYFEDPKVNIVTLDNRLPGNELVGKINIATNAYRAAGPTPLYMSAAYPINDDWKDILESWLEIAKSLNIAIGVITAMSSFDDAERLAISGDGNLAGPEWGLVLGGGYTKQVSREMLEKSNTFYAIKSLSKNQLYIQLSDDINDALTEKFNSSLKKARSVLAPILAT